MKNYGRGYLKTNRSLQAFFLLMIAGMCTASIYGQKSRVFVGGQLPVKAVRDVLAPDAGPQPTSVYVTNGEFDCKFYSLLNSADNVVDGRELFLNFGGNFSDTFEFRDYVSAYGSVDLIGAVATNPPGTINVSVNADTLVSFSTERRIVAVILRDGIMSYVYVYDIPGIRYTNDGMNLSTNGRPITGVQFCFGFPLAPSAAEAYVSGRVLTASGRGVSGARITITNAATGEVSKALTNPFGYYVIEGLEIGTFYSAEVAYKGLKFTNGTRVFTLNDSLADIDFVASP